MEEREGLENENREQVAKAASIVMVAILVSRILGFIRERAVAEVFGRTATTDVFFCRFCLTRFDVPPLGGRGTQFGVYPRLHPIPGEG